MARLTDNNGTLLGGLDTPLSHLLSPLNETQKAAITAPAAPPLAPVYRVGEIVFALHCAYGSLPTLAYAAGPSPTRRRGCDALVEEPDERHFCSACGGYYCQAHADPATHECRSVRRAE